jgi:hypothetical protein
MGLAVLLEANVAGVLAEALTTQHQVVLADQTTTMGAHPALARALSKLVGARAPDVRMNHSLVDR